MKGANRVWLFFKDIALTMTEKVVAVATAVTCRPPPAQIRID